MEETAADLFTTHLNRKFAKRVKINIGIGVLAIVVFASVLMKEREPDIWTFICLGAGVVACLWPAAVLFGARYPLRLTDQGVITRYAIGSAKLIAWQDVLGIGVHPRRGRSCLICRAGSSPEPYLMVIPWTMIEEPEPFVMAAIRHQLVLRGHQIAEPEDTSEDQAGAPEFVNPLKNFWN